jgi:tetratricopeptide (TPR) repeat protein
MLVLVCSSCVLAELAARALWAGRGRALPQALAAIAVLALAAWPVRLSVDEVDFEAEMGFAAGGRRARPGDDLGAVVALERAVARRPDFIEARYNLGLALERLDRLESAEANNDAILRLLPGHAAASQRKREVLRRKGAPARTPSGPAENQRRVGPEDWRDSKHPPVDRCQRSLPPHGEDGTV